MKSCHPQSCKSATTRGVGIRLVGLKNRTPTNQVQSLSTIYPDFHAALKSVGLLKDENKLPKLDQILDTREREQIAIELNKE